MLLGVHVEHEADESAFETRAGAHVDGEASAAEFGCALEVEDAELLAKLPVRLGGEIEIRLFAPGLDGDVVFFGFAGGDFVAREVGDARERETHLLIERGGGLVEVVELVFEGASFVHQRGGIFAFALESADLLARARCGGP